MKFIVALLVCSTAFASVSCGSPPGDVVGAITVGYQGWFACPNDGSPINRWWHWARDSAQAPAIGNSAIISYPDMREYNRTYQTGFPALGNGQPATLFSSVDEQVLDVHFQWMAEYGVDTAALQRFNPFGAEGPTRDLMADLVRAAAERHGVKFYIMYDVSGWRTMQTELREDWLQKMSVHTASPAYARQNGLPVVCIWGLGFSDDNGRPFTPEQALDIIEWFKDQGVYLIGGVPTMWRTGVADSRPNFLPAYLAFNMISPWMVGRVGSLNDVDVYYNLVQREDKELLDMHDIDYQPCVLPGNLTAHHRKHGDLMWRQFYNYARLEVGGLYISMFDEYNEANQIAKTAEDASMAPVGAGFVTLDEDGTRCSSDYYLRLTRDGGRMLKGEIPITETRPTPPIE